MLEVEMTEMPQCLPYARVQKLNILKFYSSKIDISLDLTIVV